MAGLGLFKRVSLFRSGLANSRGDFSLELLEEECWRAGKLEQQQHWNRVNCSLINFSNIIIIRATDHLSSKQCHYLCEVHSHQIPQA